MKKLKSIFIVFMCLIAFSACGHKHLDTPNNNQVKSISDESAETTKVSSAQISEQTNNDVSVEQSQTTFDLKDIPQYSGDIYTTINNNIPYFTGNDYSTESFEHYSDLDSLGRCGVAYANIGIDIMPTAERGPIGQVKPSGWKTVKYDIVDGKYLYNRCHLIGYQLSGENANEKNLITGTRYLNVQGMLPFENKVANYVKETNNHVLYRVTPIYDGNNLLASGVLMEAKSVEDNGGGICFNVYVYNVQPGITIDYTDGSSSLINTNETATTSEDSNPKQDDSSKNEIAATSEDSNPKQDNSPKNNMSYVLNNNTHKFHYPGCASAKKISPANREDYNASRDEIIANGYSPCKKCNP